MLRRRMGIVAAGGLLVVVASAWAIRATTSVSIIDVEQNLTVPRTALPAAIPGPDDWPWWRGTGADGISETATPPITWSETEHVAWSTAIPGRGHSSPIVWGQDVYLTTADETAGTQSLLNLDLSTGDIHWTREIHHGRFPLKHEKNSHASATPACDGTYVYTAFAIDDAIWVTAVDRSGEIAWQTEAGPYESHRGYGSSIALYGDLVHVLAENRGSKLGRIRATSFLAALDRATGEIVWRVRRPEVHSYGSPIVRSVAGRDQLLMIGGGEVHAYDPQTGNSLWHAATTPERAANTMAASDELVFASGGFPQAELACVRADGSGDVTGTHVVWTERKGVGDVPSLLYHAGLLYVLADNGILSAVEPATGKNVWRKRLGGNFSASPIVAGGHLYAIDEDGKTTVLTTGPDADVVAINELNDPAFATPTPAGSHLLIRTSHTLWCLKHE